MTSLPVAGIPRYEHLLRAAARLDPENADLKRYSNFISLKIREVHFRAVATASANGREIVLRFDLPITKGLAAGAKCRGLPWSCIGRRVGLRRNITHLLLVPTG